MKKFSTLAIIFFFAACAAQKPLLSAKSDNNTTYTVKYLFEYGGCKVYRFRDQGNDVYYTNCNGETVNKKDSAEIRNSIKVTGEN